MLTKEDLSQIGNVVDSKLNKRLEPFEKRFGSIDKKLNSLDKDVTYIRKSINVDISGFDKEYLDLRKRVEQIEKHLELQTH